MFLLALLLKPLFLLTLLFWPRGIWHCLVSTLLLRSLIIRRGLISTLLTIFRLLIIPLLLTAGRRYRVAARLIGRTLLLTQVARLISIAIITAHVFGLP